ncbi:hypothetical protein BT96DRAFT_999233 [Gymnopus androsaceus JB14]|uniref:Uncharacterized protein n=1 Tax=Gymnopus androsaceus JB14 TaxID=1447944 RepID=A0A6A4H7I0_9AGAR|nr:hypothetical protein BT96DRAFT_999233 [Gymnopus androsaceus JB14]
MLQHNNYKQALGIIQAQEEEHLKGFARRESAEDPALPLQIELHWQENGHFKDLHCTRLLSIKHLEGFDFANNKYFCIGIPVHMEEPMIDGVELEHFDDPNTDSEIKEEDVEDEIDAEINVALSVIVDND